MRFTVLYFVGCKYSQIFVKLIYIPRRAKICLMIFAARKYYEIFFHLLARDSEPELEPEPQSRPFLPEPEPPKYSLLRISSFRLILSFIPVFILLSPVEILLSIYLNICLSLYLYFLQFIMTEKQKLSSKKTAIYV